MYGLGLILYEMLVGKPPFVSANAAVLMRDHVVRVPVPSEPSAPVLVRELDTIVLKALAKEPRLRYQKASEVAQALVSIENLETRSSRHTLRVRHDRADPRLRSGGPEPVVALLSNYGQPVRHLFFGAAIALPLVALATLAGFGVIPVAIAGGGVVLVALGGQLGPAVGLSWAVCTMLLFLFVPGLAVVHALLGLWLWARDVPPERTALAMAMPVAAPFGLAPALVLTAAAVEGLLGVVTPRGARSCAHRRDRDGPSELRTLRRDRLCDRAPTLFDPVRAAQRAPLCQCAISTSDRFGPLAASRPGDLVVAARGARFGVVGSDVAAIARCSRGLLRARGLAVTRMLRALRTAAAEPRMVRALRLRAGGRTIAGASILSLLFFTWGPLSKAAAVPPRTCCCSPHSSVHGGHGGGVVLSATTRPEVIEETAIRVRTEGDPLSPLLVDRAAFVRRRSRNRSTRAPRRKIVRRELLVVRFPSVRASSPSM